MKIYTKTGDEGITGCWATGGSPRTTSGSRPTGRSTSSTPCWAWPVPRGSIRPPTAWSAQLQDELFAVGSALADPDPKGTYHNAIKAEHATRLEGIIDALESSFRR